MAPPLSSAGLTLVEMLAVLAIIGVVSGAAVLGLGALGQGGGAEAEARMLGARLRLASDEAMITDRPIALNWTGSGYAFVDPAGGNAKPVPDPLPELGRPHDLRRGVSLSVEAARSPLPIVADGTGAPVRALLDDGLSRWLVRFDGFDVVTEPAGAR